MDYLAVLKDLITNYEKFCHVALGLEWINIEAEYNDWFKEQEYIISKIKGAEITETGGSYYADYEYVAVKGDTVIMVCCGLWA